MKIRITCDNKTIKLFSCYNIKSANDECREIEREYNLTKYKVKWEEIREAK